MIQRIGCKVTGSLLLHSFVNCRDRTLSKCWSPSYSFRACNKTIWLRSVRQRHSRMIAVHSRLLSSPIHHFLCTQVTPIMRHKMRRHKWDSDTAHWFWPGVCPETKKSQIYSNNLSRCKHWKTRYFNKYKDMTKKHEMVNTWQLWCCQIMSLQYDIMEDWLK